MNGGFSMKKRFRLAAVLLCLFCVTVLCECRQKQETVTLRIVDGANTGQLVLAGTSGSEVYTLSVDDIAVYLDDEKADASALEDGMAIDILHSGAIEERWPAQFGKVYEIRAYSLGTQKNPGGRYYDLCGLYLQVLNDLWDKDRGLNNDINYVSIDLSLAPGDLTAGEKAAIAWIFANAHKAEPLTLTAKELLEQGYLTEIVLTGTGLSFNDDKPKPCMWEDGLLFTITNNGAEDDIYSLPVIMFDAMKWRTPLGAYYFGNCSAVWPEMGTWSEYNIGAELIS